MELGEALLQIRAIRAQVLRTENFRAYRAATVGCTGILALIAAGWQARWVPQTHQDPLAYVRYWVLVAAVSVTLVAVEIALRCWRTNSRLARRQTWQAVEQFLPCVLAGALLTWALLAFSLESLGLLPGLWSVIFSLGVFASLRQLPRAVVVAGIYYLVAGIACLAWARGDYALSPWAMAGSFGGGQLLTAGILYWNLERRHEAA